MDRGTITESEQSSEVPPSYFTLFPDTHPEVHTQEPLAAAAWHNKICSPLHRLPDKVLVQIIDMLDNSGVECIRRVARKFPPLCSEPILNRPRTEPVQEAKEKDEPFVWPRFQSMCHSGQAAELLRTVEGYDDSLPGDRPRLLRLLDRDWYCDGCRGSQDAPDWGERVARLRRRLHCSVCLADHPAYLFSRSQRLVKAHHRVCIVHEGYSRICSHETGVIRWRDLQKLDHKFSSSRAGNTSCLQCRDASHVVLCKETADSNLDGPGRDPGCGENRCGELIFPTVNLMDLKGKNSSTVSRMNLHWTAHLPLGQADLPLTAAALRPRLAELRDNTGQFICPPQAPGMKDLTELRCFDPNKCDCVAFDSLREVSAFSGGHTVSNRLLPPESLTQPRRDLSRPWQAEDCKYKERNHTSWWHFGPRSTYGSGTSHVIIRPCHGGGRCLVVDYSRSFRAGSVGQLDRCWYHALDPESYNLTADRDGLGVYWCRQQQCRNYYGGIPGFSRIIYTQDYSTRCPGDCE